MRKIAIYTMFGCLYSCLNITAFGQEPVSFLNEQKSLRNTLTNELDQYNMLHARDVGFSKNIGQLKDEDVFYYSFGKEAKIVVSNQGISLFFQKYEKQNNAGDSIDGVFDSVSVTWNRIDINLENSNIQQQNIRCEKMLSHSYNWYIGGQSTAIKTYEKLVLENVLPGVDWVIYNSTSTGFKYDFVVHPGANVNDIKLNYLAKNSAVIAKDGSLNLANQVGGIKEEKPVSYLLGDVNAKINTRFELITIREESNLNNAFYKTTIGFILEDYNPNETVVIDPSVTWNYNLTPTADEEYVLGSIVDQNDDLYVVGATYSNNLPTLNPGGGAYYDGTHGGNSDGYIMKLSSSGALLWLTYYGAGGVDRLTGIACNMTNTIAVVGYTNSNAAALTFQNLAGAFNDNSFAAGLEAGLLLTFNYSGQMTWGTSFGEAPINRLTQVAFDNNNKLYVAGYGRGAGFPLLNLAGAYNFNTNVDATNHDIFIARFSSARAQEWGTYYGGTTAGVNEQPHAMAIDGSNNIYIGGLTRSTNFPCVNLPGAFPNDNTHNGGLDGFILKFNSNGARLWATYMGGNTRDYVSTIVIRGTHKYISGVTNSTNFIVNHAPFPSQPVGAYVDLTINGTSNSATSDAGPLDIFLIKLNASDNIQWSTLIGGTGSEELDVYADQQTNVAVNSCGNVFITFPTTTNSLSAGTIDGLPGLQCDAGYSSTVFDNSNPILSNYYIACFTQGGVLKWGSYCGQGSIAHDNFCTLQMTSTNDLLWAGGIGQWPEVKVSKFRQTTQTITGGGTPLCNCTATVNPTAACAGTNSYLWDNGATTQSIGSLCNGTYTVSVTDNIMCQTTPLSFTLTNCAISLPIELIAFEAQLNDKNRVDLTWKTATELNNDYFTIEKSIDAKNWYFFAQVDGSGNSTTQKDYFLTDEKPIINLNYYRLSQTDFDGTRKEIGIQNVMLSVADQFILAPNPSDQSFRIYGNRMDEVTIEVINSIGQLIHIEKSSITDDFVEIATEQLESGVYFVRFPGEDSQQVQRIVIQH